MARRRLESPFSYTCITVYTVQQTNEISRACTGCPVIRETAPGRERRKRINEFFGSIRIN